MNKQERNSLTFAGTLKPKNTKNHFSLSTTFILTFRFCFLDKSHKVHLLWSANEVRKMVKTIINVDPKKLPWEQDTPVHNRWHPDIPPVATVKEGEAFRVECIDWTGGQIKNNDSSDDVKNIDLTQVHYLSGPIEIPTAQPGDLLKVEILNLGTLDGDEWGFTGTFAKENGGGFLTDHYPCASKACWDLEGIYCTR